MNIAKLTKRAVGVFQGLKRKDTGAPYLTVSGGSGTAAALQSAMYALSYSRGLEGTRIEYATKGPGWQDLRRYAKEKRLYYRDSMVPLGVKGDERILLNREHLKELRLAAEFRDPTGPIIVSVGTLSRGGKTSGKDVFMEDKEYKAAIALVDRRLLDEMLGFIGWADTNSVHRYGDVVRRELGGHFNEENVRQVII